MDNEPYDFDQFIQDAKEFIGLLFICLFGIGLFYVVMLLISSKYNLEMDPKQYLWIAIIAGGIWTLVGYWGELLDIDIRKILNKPLFQKKKGADHNKRNKP